MFLYILRNNGESKLNLTLFCENLQRKKQSTHWFQTVSCILDRIFLNFYSAKMLLQPLTPILTESSTGLTSWSKALLVYNYWSRALSVYNSWSWTLIACISWSKLAIKSSQLLFESTVTSPLALATPCVRCQLANRYELKFWQNHSFVWIKWLCRPFAVTGQAQLDCFAFISAANSFHEI